MRKITKNSVNAFYNKSDFRGNNTVVEYLKQPHMESSHFYLFGNEIATLNHRTGVLTVTNCGYKTVTTKERLNGILSPYNHGIRQKKGVWEFLKWNCNTWEVVEEFQNNTKIKKA